MNILIVDDEVSALRDLARTLKKTVSDAQIKQADRAETALTIIRHFIYSKNTYIPVKIFKAPHQKFWRNSRHNL